MKLEIVVNRASGEVDQIYAVDEFTGDKWAFEPDKVEVKYEEGKLKAIVEFNKISWRTN